MTSPLRVSDQTASRCNPQAKVAIDTSRLQCVKVPIQDMVLGTDAYYLGLGPDASRNLSLREWVGKPGAPFGGIGFFNLPQGGSPVGGTPAPPKLTAEVIRDIKLKEFQRCAEGMPSMYFWALQPIYDVHDYIVAAEVLVRARNGYDGAPYDDVSAIMDPKASDETHQVYVLWKATEVVDWPLRVLKEQPVLQSLWYLSVNMRPLDLCPASGLYEEVRSRLDALCAEDRQLLLRSAQIEVTEDQTTPVDFVSSLQMWRDLGFSLAYDDTIGELACEALGKTGENFHTTLALEPFLLHFPVVKVDIDWAGFLIFLSHPAYVNRPEIMKEVLRRAREDDVVCIPRGQTMCEVTGPHSALLAEFATWVKRMIQQGKQVNVELTVRPDNENNAFSLGKLQELHQVDIFGAHRSSFAFQGGLTGPRAFHPAYIANNARVIFQPDG